MCRVFARSSSALRLQRMSRQSLRPKDPKKAEWVQACLRDFESIKAGMTREQVEKKFPMDGGLQTASPTRFVHPQCRYFKIEVGFEFQRDEADGNRAVMGKTDKVIAVSKPYLERPFAD